MVTRLLIVYFLIILVTSQVTLRQSNIFAQQSPNDTVKIESKGKDQPGRSSQNELLLKYVEILSEEAEKHRIFINNEAEKHRIFIGKLFIGICSFVTIAIGLLSWFTWKSAEEVYSRRFERRFEKKLKNIEVYETRLTEITDNSDIYFRALARAIVVTTNIGNKEDAFDERKLKGKEILWVDDKHYNIADFKLLLKSLGSKVTSAETTSDTIEHLKNNHFDLIITNLGRANDGGNEAGLDLLEKVRQTQKPIPIIIFTRPENKYLCKSKLDDNNEVYFASGFRGIIIAIVNILCR